MCTSRMFCSSLQKMALLKYFKHIKPPKEESVLPKPDGPLACLMPSSAIEAANSTVSKTFTDGAINVMPSFRELT